MGTPADDARQHARARRPSVDATCRTCKRSVSLNVDGWPADVPVPDVGLRLVCSTCGGKEIETRPDWREFNPPKGWMAPGTARSGGKALTRP
jgi:hypothetical protein